MDIERAAPLTHRPWLYSEIATEEKRRLWLGSDHQVATNAHAIRRPFLFAGTWSRIMSKISGGRVTDEFGPDGSGGFSSKADSGGELVVAHRHALS